MTTEQIYQEFTTKLLPQIQAGLTITKDYFIELFGRYIKFLIITDIVAMLAAILVLIALVFTIRKLVVILKKMDDYDDARIFVFMGICSSGMAILFCLTTIYGKGIDVIKDIYLPEIRVYETLKDYAPAENK